MWSRFILIRLLFWGRHEHKLISEDNTKFHLEVNKNFSIENKHVVLLSSKFWDPMSLFADLSSEPLKIPQWWGHHQLGSRVPSWQPVSRKCCVEWEQVISQSLTNWARWDPVVSSRPTFNRWAINDHTFPFIKEMEYSRIEDFYQDWCTLNKQTGKTLSMKL